MKVWFFASLDCGDFVKDTVSWNKLFSKTEPGFTREAELNFSPLEEISHLIHFIQWKKGSIAMHCGMMRTQCTQQTIIIGNIKPIPHLIFFQTPLTSDTFKATNHRPPEKLWPLQSHPCSRVADFPTVFF